jgi:hypothetical protein
MCPELFSLKFRKKDYIDLYRNDIYGLALTLFDIVSGFKSESSSDKSKSALSNSKSKLDYRNVC